MVSAIAALQASLSSGTNASPVRLEPGMEVRAKVEANLPNNVLKLSVGSSTIEVRANASLPQGTELTLKVTGEPGKTQIQLLPDAKPAASQPAQTGGGLAAQAAGGQAKATDPATVQKVIQAATQQTAQLSSQTTASTPSAPVQTSAPSAQATQAAQTVVNSGQATQATQQTAPQASQVQATAQQVVATQTSQTASAPQPLPQNAAQTAPAPQSGSGQAPQQPAAAAATQPAVTPTGAASVPQAPAPSASPPAAQPLPQTGAQTPANPVPAASAPTVNSGPASAPVPVPAGNLPGSLQLQSFEAQPRPGGGQTTATLQTPTTPAGGAAPQSALSGQPSAPLPTAQPGAASQSLLTGPSASGAQVQPGTAAVAQGATPAVTPTAQVLSGAAPVSSQALPGQPAAAPTATPSSSVTPPAATAPQAPGTSAATPSTVPGAPVQAPSAPPPGTVTPTAVFANVVTEETVTGGIRVSLPTSAYSSGAPASQTNSPEGVSQKLTVTPQLKQAADTVMPKLAEQQAGLSNLFAQLGALTGGQSQAGANLPEPVKQVMQQILGLQIQPNADGVSAKQVEAAVKNSGLFREAGLLRQAGTGQGGAQTLAQATDLKSLLLNLKGMLQDLGARSLPPQPLAQPPIPSLKRSPQGERPASTSSIIADGDEQSALNRLLHDTDAALSRVRLHQMVSRGLGAEDHAMQGRAMDMTVDLPILVNGQTAIVQMQVGRDPEGSQGEDGEGAPGWRLRFALDLTETGPMEAAISLRGGGTYVSLWVDRGDTLERLSAEKETLEAAFAHAGLDVKEIRFLRGLPRRTEARFGAMVDRQS